MTFPDPVIGIAIEPKTKGDIDKLGMALAKLAEELEMLREHMSKEAREASNPDHYIEIGDIVEIIKDIPGKNIRAGMQGTVVHSHGNDVYEVEFTNEAGETLDFLALPARHFIVVWQAATSNTTAIAASVLIEPPGSTGVF